MLLSGLAFKQHHLATWRQLAELYCDAHRWAVLRAGVGGAGRGGRVLSEARQRHMLRVSK